MGNCHSNGCAAVIIALHSPPHLLSYPCTCPFPIHFVIPLSFPLMSQCCLRCYHNFSITASHPNICHVRHHVLVHSFPISLHCVFMSSCLSSSFIICVLCQCQYCLCLLSRPSSWILTSVMPSHSLPVIMPSILSSSFSPKLMGSNHPFTASHPCTVSLLSPLFYHCFTSSCLLFVISTHSQTHPFPYYYKFFLLLHILILS